MSDIYQDENDPYNPDEFPSSIPRNLFQRNTLPPEGGSVQKEIRVSEAKDEILDAAEEGRVSIRAKEVAPKVLDALATKFTPDILVKKMEKLLGATKTIVAAGRPMEVDDPVVQLNALKLLLQYQVGMPVARSEVVTHNYDTMQTLESKMQSSPALRRAVSRMIEKAQITDPKGLIEAESSDLTDEEYEEASNVLAEAPVVEDSPITVEVKQKIATNSLKSKSDLDIDFKYNR